MSCAVQNLSNLPAKPDDHCAVDLYGPLPVGRFGFRYIFVCFDVFSKFVKLYSLKAATMKAYLNKVVNDYVINMTRPRCILSDHGTQFSSKKWKDKLAELSIGVTFSPMRHPQANPSERCRRETGKFCRIYCNEAHKR
jgi:transposase InsO family protein